MQTAPVLLGQYRPLDSFLHRLDARAKLLPVLVVMIVGVLTSAYTFYMVLLGLLFVGLLSSGIEPITLVRNLRPIVLLAGVTFVYHLIFSDRGGEPLIDIFGYTVTKGGFSQAIFFSLRLLLFVAVAFLVTLTSSPSDLAEGLVKLAAPLKRLRIPVDDLGLILFIAIRFIPILYEEFTTIRNAQIIRGVDFGGRLLGRARKMTYIIIPVLIAALGRADDLALAMEARGYQSGGERTFYSRSRLTLANWIFMVAVSAAVVGLYMYTG